MWSTLNNVFASPNSSPTGSPNFLSPNSPKNGEDNGQSLDIYNSIHSNKSTKSNKRRIRSESLSLFSSPKTINNNDSITGSSYANSLIDVTYDEMDHIIKRSSKQKLQKYVDDLYQNYTKMKQKFDTAFKDLVLTRNELGILEGKNKILDNRTKMEDNKIKANRDHLKEIKKSLKQEKNKNSILIERFNDFKNKAKQSRNKVIKERDKIQNEYNNQTIFVQQLCDKLLIYKDKLQSFEIIVFKEYCTLVAPKTSELVKYSIEANLVYNYNSTMNNTVKRRKESSLYLPPKSRKESVNSSYNNSINSNNNNNNNNNSINNNNGYSDDDDVSELMIQGFSHNNKGEILEEKKDANNNAILSPPETVTPQASVDSSVKSQKIVKVPRKPIQNAILARSLGDMPKDSKRKSKKKSKKVKVKKKKQKNKKSKRDTVYNNSDSDSLNFDIMQGLQDNDTNNFDDYNSDISNNLNGASNPKKLSRRESLLREQPSTSTFRACELILMKYPGTHELFIVITKQDITTKQEFEIFRERFERCKGIKKYV